MAAPDCSGGEAVLRQQRVLPVTGVLPPTLKRAISQVNMVRGWRGVMMQFCCL